MELLFQELGQDITGCDSDDKGCMINISRIKLNGEYIEIKQPDFDNYNFTGSNNTDMPGTRSIMGLYELHKNENDYIKRKKDTYGEDSQLPLEKQIIELEKQIVKQ